MAIAATDIKYYLTDIDPLSAQDEREQSVGGYPSTTEVARYSPLSATIGLKTVNFNVSDQTPLIDMKALQIGAEIIEVVSITGPEQEQEEQQELQIVQEEFDPQQYQPHVFGEPITAIRRGARGTKEMIHVTNANVRAVSPLELFNGQFSADLTQYRCIAIKNTSTTQVANNVSFYLKSAGVNPGSTMRIAVEHPLTDTTTGTATGGTKLSLTNTSISSSFNDDDFKNCVLTFTSGANVNLTRVISAYDKDTRSFSFTSALTTAIAAGVTYRVDAGPSQRLLSGTNVPASGTSRVSAFSKAPNGDAAISINATGNRKNGVNMQPLDVVYVWFERRLMKNVPGSDKNAVVLAMRYSI